MLESGVETGNGVLKGRKFRGNFFFRGIMSVRDATIHNHASGQPLAVGEFLLAAPAELRDIRFRMRGLYRVIYFISERMEELGILIGKNSYKAPRYLLDNIPLDGLGYSPLCAQ